MDTLLLTEAVFRYFLTVIFASEDWDMVVLEVVAAVN